MDVVDADTSGDHRPFYAYDADLFFQCGYDAALYVMALRQQGRVSPTELEIEAVPFQRHKPRVIPTLSPTIIG